MTQLPNDVPQTAGRYPICFIIPTFNRSATLIACLKKLESQTFADFEVIVVDDGSTDTTQAEMDLYMTEAPLRIRYYRQQNSGPARARNVGVAQARAPICILIGDDIMVSPDFTAVHLRFHTENPDLCFVGLGLTRWSESGQKVTPLMRWLDESGVQFAYTDLFRGVKPNWKHFYTSNLSLKTELLRKNPFDERFNKAMMEDIELGYRLEVQHNLKIGFLPEAYAEHIHPTDFRKTCRRAYGVGYASVLFEKLWPASVQARSHGTLYRTTREILCRNAWFFLRPITWVTEIITRFWCPNPLLMPILAYHSALGRRSAETPARFNDTNL
jgi:glycosyltransferase involved in cell wall biosynthesis